MNKRRNYILNFINYLVLFILCYLNYLSFESIVVNILRFFNPNVNVDGCFIYSKIPFIKFYIYDILLLFYYFIIRKFKNKDMLFCVFSLLLFVVIYIYNINIIESTCYFSKYDIIGYIKEWICW